MVYKEYCKIVEEALVWKRVIVSLLVPAKVWLTLKLNLWANIMQKVSSIMDKLKKYETTCQMVSNSET